MKANDKVERNGEVGIVMNTVNDTVYVWWNVTGKYQWEPCDITTLKRIIPDDEVDAIALEGDDMSKEDLDKLVDWVLDFKKTLGGYRAN